MLQSSKLSYRFKQISNKDNGNLNDNKNLENTCSCDNVYANQVIPEDKELSLDVVAIKKALLDKLELIPVWFDYTEEQQKELINNFLENKLKEQNIKISNEQKLTVMLDLYSEVIGFGPLNYFIEKDNVSSVFVNGKNSVYIEIEGKVLNTEVKLSDKQLNFILNNILKMAEITLDKKQSIYSLRLGKLFVTLILPEVSLSGLNIIIRKNIEKNLDSFVKEKFMTKEIYNFLLSIVENKKNIVFSGEINSGKSTLLNFLLKEILSDKRCVLIENMPQILVQSDSLIKYKVNKNMDLYQDLLSNVLKLSPEYIVTDTNFILPELIERNGILSSIRAISFEDAFAKLVNSLVVSENLVEKYAKTKVLTDIDYIVQINKDEFGVSRITSIVELSHAKTLASSKQLVFEFVDGQYVNYVNNEDNKIKEKNSNLMSARFENSFE